MELSPRAACTGTAVLSEATQARAAREHRIQPEPVNIAALSEPRGASARAQPQSAASDPRAAATEHARSYRAPQPRGRALAEVYTRVLHV